MNDEHYLKKELYGQVSRAPEIFEFLQSGSLDGIWYWDLENPEHEWISHRFWEVLGYDPASKKHMSSEWQDMIHPDDLKLALENFHKHCADPAHNFDQYVRYRHKDGSTVWVRCRGIAIRDTSGKAIRMLGAHTDVTALKRAEEVARTLASELAAANKELEAFSYSVSHDLRAPLRAVDGFSRILIEDHAAQLDDESRRLLGLVRNGAQRMGRLIDDLLAFSRLGRQKLVQTSIDMYGMAQAVFDELAAQDPERRLRLDIRPIPVAHGTEPMIRQVWENLISNAIKFTKEHDVGEIEIGVRDGEKGEKIYYVKDNGAGFDVRYAGKLFGVFQRLHRAEEFPGTGVGLAFVQRIVQRHGGRIWAEAELNRGATFYFTIPDARE